MSLKAYKKQLAKYKCPNQFAHNDEGFLLC